MMFAAGIIFFSFFYTAIMFDPKDVADNLEAQGAYVPGIRPGQQTSKYIDDVITRLTVFGALYVTLVCLLPEFMVVFFNTSFQLGGTAVLIVVVVAMDFMSQVQSHLMSQPVREVDGKVETTKLWAASLIDHHLVGNYESKSISKENLSEL